jgi:hypothetical protein
VQGGALLVVSGHGVRSLARASFSRECINAAHGRTPALNCAALIGDGRITQLLVREVGRCRCNECRHRGCSRLTIRPMFVQRGPPPVAGFLFRLTLGWPRSVKRGGKGRQPRARGLPAGARSGANRRSALLDFGASCRGLQRRCAALLHCRRRSAKFQAAEGGRRSPPADRDPFGESVTAG